jgi:hypothetical protein
MDLVPVSVVVAAAAAVALAAMLTVRRCAPGGSYFRDGDRASGVFGVMASPGRGSRGYPWDHPERVIADAPVSASLGVHDKETAMSSGPVQLLAIVT